MCESLTRRCWVHTVGGDLGPYGNGAGTAHCGGDIPAVRPVRGASDTNLLAGQAGHAGRDELLVRH
jgi:hypothetical protein